MKKYLWLAVFVASLALFAGCSVTTVSEETALVLRTEIEQFFDNYEQALLSNDLDQIITFYTVPYTVSAPSGSKITLSSWEELRTHLNTYLGLEESEIVEDSFEITDVTFSSETRAIVLAEEHWVQTADGEAWEATDSLRITLIKVSGSWKFQKIELLGWRRKRG